MRILQIIDSLEAGGAERMAVSYANSLGDKINFSGIVVTRKEGVLRDVLDKNVSCFFINKNGKIDFKAIFKLKKIVVDNQITHLHAHGSSFFTAFLLKIVHPNIKLIWHDHYGNSEFLGKRPKMVLKIAIPFFYGIISVNQKLKTWAEKNKLSENVIYLPNFPSKLKEVSEHTLLKGLIGKRIVCLANLRAQKNHFFLLEVASKVKKAHPDWTFHLVGKDFQDDYSKQIKEKIMQLNLEDEVFIYNSRQDIANILEQSDIAILTSLSEGLPVSLLEYGWYKKPVVVTNVGEIATLIKNGINGFIVSSQDEKSYYDALLLLIENNALQKSIGDNLYEDVVKQYSEASIIKEYLIWVQNSFK